MRFVISLLVSVAVLGAQAPAVSLRETPTTNLPSQRMGPDDLIGLSVYDTPELTRTIRIGPDGFIRLPMLAQLVRAEGLMPGELEIAIASALKKEHLLTNPFVTVTMVEYHSRPISVLGAVRRPVTFQAVGFVTLIDALTRAEGLASDASGEILVSRTDSAGNRTMTQRIRVRDLIDTGDPALNLRLTGGEEIRVPVTDKVVIVGNVKKPGQYPISDTGPMTVMSAIALSEGLAPFASKVAYIERSTDKSRAKSEIPVDLRKIMDRKIPDVELQAKDTLYIPDDRGSRIAAGALEKILGFGAATGSGFLIWH